MEYSLNMVTKTFFYLDIKYNRVHICITLKTLFKEKRKTKHIGAKKIILSFDYLKNVCWYSLIVLSLTYLQGYYYRQIVINLITLYLWNVFTAWYLFIIFFFKSNAADMKYLISFTINAGVTLWTAVEFVWATRCIWIRTTAIMPWC